MKLIKKVSGLCGIMMIAMLFVACGKKSGDSAVSVKEPQKPDVTEEADETPEISETPQSMQKPTPAVATATADRKERRRIEEQSFSISISPLGKVEFFSYAPDLSISKYADVTFEIENGDKDANKLEGMDTSDLREGIIFKQVEAVSFKDYNNDSYGDIIIICSYEKEEKMYSEARIYSGSRKGEFTLERQISSDVNGALSKLTIQNILDFLGVGRTEETDSPWKQAYIDVITKDDKTTPWEGYALIYVDDDEIPELVKIGSFEAMGCMIVNYSDGNAHETQLDRLGFTYIPKENLLCNSDGLMDCNYDLVYSIIDGRMTQIAAGYYDAVDNSNVQFDEKGEVMYQYKWNGAIVNQEEYQKQLKAVYDREKALDGYYSGEYFSAEEMIEQIKN